MVHDKTEYRKNFKWTSPVRRQQIWEENWKFRRSQKLKEFRHEPFKWEGWECDCSSDDENDYEITEICPSKLRSKHQRLIESKKHKAKSCAKEKVEKGIQTPVVIFSPRSTSPEKCVQTDITIPLNSKNLTKFVREDSTQTDAELFKSVLPLAQTSNPIKKPQYPKSSLTSTTKDAKKLFPPYRVRVRKAFSESRPKSPFASYGWADNNRDVSKKQTYNIRAARNVHPSAKQAERKRLADPRWYISRNYIIPYRNEPTRPKTERGVTNASALFDISRCSSSCKPSCWNQVNRPRSAAPRL